jgi:hypothetical protein
MVQSSPFWCRLKIKKALPPEGSACRYFTQQHDTQYDVLFKAKTDEIELKGC